ncbi:hypothetical protein OEA41_009634 [Lepraria neglecta]|uniref:Uncharacterized protein n=1 Tax=Lepraria neglecta TaxID=209136 RepID=A0AAE0DH29_9LECA|nr:hypothetical protein OEA41_009634 [Lepraria neglecta]
MELLTNFPGRRSLFSQLKRDLSEDRQLSHVDIICSYIKQSGPAAIKDLASIIGEDNLKVATHFVKDVTFHAKGWRFHESQPSVPPDGEPGYSHAIIGSSNMSYPALNVGVECNAGANQGLMITPTPEVDMEDAPSAYSNTPLLDQQHNLHISGPSSPSSTSAKRPQEDDHESALQPTKRRSLVFSQATRVSGPPPFDADQSIISEVEQFVESTYELFSNQVNGLRDELTSFANQSISTAGDTTKTSARIAIGIELLQKIPLGQTGAVEIARIAKLSRFVSGHVWRAMSLRQDPSLRQSLTAIFVTQTMREAAQALQARVYRFTNVYQEAEIVVSKAAFWTIAAVLGLSDTYVTTARALDTFFRGAQGQWNDEEIVIAIKMAMESQSSELEDLAMLVILAAQSNGDFGEKFKDAGGQRWKEWLREKKEDPNVGHFLRGAYPQDE